MIDLRHGDCLAVLRAMPDVSVDAVVCDPPYGLAEHRVQEVAAAMGAWCSGDRERVPTGKGFMGRDWDAFVPPPAVWDECLRVLKPGGHLLAFAGSRTYDLMGLSIRLAGFEMRDGLQWLYGSGFPKGIDVGKAIDKAAGIARDVIGETIKTSIPKGRGYGRDENGRPIYLGLHGGQQRDQVAVGITAPATPEAARWDGWNTSLKPAHEPIVLARKPLAGTVAANVLGHGTGALNIGATRVATDENQSRPRGTFPHSDDAWSNGRPNEASVSHPAGRWPANVLLSHLPECGPEEDPQPCAPGCVVAELDAQSGTTASPTEPVKQGGRKATRAGTGAWFAGDDNPDVARDGVGVGYGDVGGASRFFPTFRYQAKAPTRERPKIDGKGWPTVKPLGLMRWLVRLVTPPGGLVLDPFAGTGTTLQAAGLEGFSAIGIERDPLALQLACQRLGLPEPVEPTPAPVLRAVLELRSPTLLELVTRAGDMSTLVLLYRAHCATWSPEVNDAAKRRRAELEAISPNGSSVR